MFERKVENFKIFKKAVKHSRVYIYGLYSGGVLFGEGVQSVRWADGNLLAD